MKQMKLLQTFSHAISLTHNETSQMSIKPPPFFLFETNMQKSTALKEKRVKYNQPGLGIKTNLYLYQGIIVLGNIKISYEQRGGNISHWASYFQKHKPPIKTTKYKYGSQNILYTYKNCHS